jgi:uncharacterized membrane protein YfcA
MFPESILFPSLLAFIMVLVGAVLQMTTGVGLGLIAGPSLLFVMPAPMAIQTAILLNLLLSVVMLPFEFRLIERISLKRLSTWACIGIPFGCLFLVTVDSTSLKLFCGVVVLLATLQLKFAKPGAQTAEASGRIIGIGGSISGAMTGALAIPGPVALWALLSAGLNPQETRATLRAYFVIAYTFAFLIHSFLTGISSTMLTASLILSPAVLGGMCIGYLARRRLSTFLLTLFLEVILFLMGASLVIKAISEYQWN